MSAAPARARRETPARRSHRLDPLPTAVLVIVAVLATGLIAALSGAVAPLALADPGPAVRWGIPLLRVVHDAAATVTIGALVIGGVVVPETTRTDRRRSLARMAGASAVVWLVAGLALVPVDFADLAGLPLDAPGFVDQLLAFAWSLESTRAQILSALVVAVVAAGALVARTKGAMVWLTVLAWLALMPLALAGHSASSADHMTGVNALAVHLLTATTWIGGLVALVAVRPQLGAHLVVSVRRYSSIAGWCYALLVGSGLLISWVNLGTVEAFVSAYGAILGVKTLAAVLLGVAGWWHRSRIIATLEQRGRSAAAFVRLAVGEIAVMGLATGAGVAVSRTPPPEDAAEGPAPSLVYDLTGYPDPGPPEAGAWLIRWQIDWLWLTVAVIACLLYLRWVLRLRRRGDDWSTLRTISWVLGWAVLVCFTSGAPGVYGKVLFSWHMVEHMGIAMIAPLLLVPGAPITLALRALPARPDKTLGPRELLLACVHSSYLKVLANPAVAASIFFFSLAIFYYSPLFELALSTHTGHVLMIVHFLLSGYVFTWVLIGIDPGPVRWSPLALLVVLFVTISFHAFFGVILTDSETLLADGFFERLGLPWAPDALEDQQNGGAIAWGLGEVPTLVLAIAVALRWMRQDDRETRRRDRRADRDGDAELAAYNERLQQMPRR